MSAAPKLRCAVYTRKSSEEGLDQEFNSLAAQREACAAFIASQTGLGWKVVLEPYDDGGISGGTMDRPGLQRLLQDIRDRKVDVVVVYKIDRLTRSLMDFAKIVEVFDAHGVSFVSVTQQFNTTTSMGRLTLNVLLSFAQFEREVTAERIRDKIAASKRKGMWMGGRVPLGYKVVDRKLVIDEPRAELVRLLFSRYFQLRSVPALVQEINRAQVNAGADCDADIVAWWRRLERPMGRGQLYHMLSNPIYIGKLRHKGTVFDGEHDAIISADVFEMAQKLLESRAPSRSRRTNAAGIHVLTGLVFDETGDRLSPTYTTKQGRRYSYYVSGRLKTGGDRNGGWRIPAVELERLVEQQAKDLLNDRTQLSGWIAEAASMEKVGIGLSAATKMADEIADSATYDTRQVLRIMFDRIILSSTSIKFIVNHRALALHLAGEAPAVDAPTTEACIAVERAFNLKRRGVEARLVISGRLDKDRAPDQSLVELIGRAHFYLSRLTGPAPMTIGELAKSVGSHPADISRIIPLAYISPAITSAILTGRQPIELTARMLARQIDLPPSWREQATIIGI